jgi:signal transduction histidine kinase
MPEIKILIVDDRAENLLALEAAFKGCKYTLVKANSGQEALREAFNHDFACALLDVQMPIMDGFETAKALRKIPRFNTTPVIFVTAIHREDGYEEMGYFAGAVDYLFKPINTNILLAKVTIFVDLFLKSEEIKRKNQLLQDALERSKEFEQVKMALKTRDDFLQMAAHELKTPITPLSLQMETFIQLVENDTFLSIDKSKILRMLQTSQAQIERLSRLVHELVDVSKLTAHRLELNLREVNLKDLVLKVIEDFEPEIRKYGSLIRIEEQDSIGNWDGFRIEQVIVNLLTNALKYGEGKTISISISNEANHAIFNISDEGIGIANVDHERIFNRFERAVSQEHFSGLGMGLFIVREIVLLHGGEISLNSTPGSGSTFKVRLPK